MSSPTDVTISVIIPVHNGGLNFRRCLSNLAEVLPAPNETIVVADGDTDGSWRVAEEFGARVLRLLSPQGPARARNLGARIAQGDILMFVDADVTLCRDALAQVRAAFEREPDLTAIFGSYDDEPAAGNFLSQYKNLFHHYIHQTSREEAATFFGACGAIRREIFLAVGGFDERYRQPCIEDVELGYRLRRAGHRIRLCKALQGKHLKRWGLISLLKADFFYRALPWTELIWRDRRFINDLNFRPSSRISVLLTWGLLGALILALWWPGFIAVAIVLAFVLLSLNLPLYLFFLRKRGLGFTLMAIPWHWFYYFYSGVAFALGTARYLVQGPKLPSVDSAQVPPRGSAEN